MRRALEETHGRPKLPQPPRGAEPAPSERLRAHEWLAKAIGLASPVAADATRRPGGALLAPACAAIAWLCACAAPAHETELRVLVKLAQPSSDTAAITRLVSNRAGVTARYFGSSGAAWHALRLPCDGAADCEAVLQRLRADRGAFEIVDRDERKLIVKP